MKVCIAVVGLLGCLHVSAQYQKATGRILYEQMAGGRVQYIEMWFTPSAYMYTMRNRPEDFFIKGKKYGSAEDSLKDVAENEKIALLINEGQPDQVWYGSLADQIVLNSAKLLDDGLIVTADTMEFVKWQILSDTATIDGILCQKAAGLTPKGTGLTAWFALSIPVSAAPFTLRGLPGLLIQVKYNNSPVQTRTLQLDWPVKGDVVIDYPGKEKIISKTEMKNRIEEHNAKAMQLLEYYKRQEKERVKGN